ncbi:protein involved in gliding motility GldG [bacterium A37T11]|nr:protein involved in gliding motility GldG [bacterium A37T11]
MLSIIQKEIADFFNDLTGCLIAGLFLLVLGLLLWVFPGTSIPEYGIASLEGFFNLAPYVLLFLVPAICMQSISVERNSGTLELLLTRPLSVSQLLWAKYLGCFSMVCLALLPTLLYYYSVYELGATPGNIDTGATIGSYLGLLLLAGAFSAISIWASAMSRSVLVAFLLSVFFCFIGYYVFSALDEDLTSGFWGYFISMLGMDSHYQSLSRGVINAPDVIYFASVILLFMRLANDAMQRGPRKLKGSLMERPLMIGLLLIANYAASLYTGRLDLTADNRYTLSPLTRETVAHLPDELHISVFLTGNMPAGFRRLAKGVDVLLSDMKRDAGGRLKFSFIDPLTGDAGKKQQYQALLAEKGIVPINVSVLKNEGLMQQLIFPAALVSFHGKDVPVFLLLNRMGLAPEEVLNNSIQNLEYAFTAAIRKALNGGKPLVGFTESHGELNDTVLYDLMSSLSDGYQAGRVDLKTITADGLRHIKVLVVPKPLRAFSEDEKYKLDYFVQYGGHILWAIDQTNASLDNLNKTGEGLFIAKKLNLDDMLFKYGVRFNYVLLGDMNCSQIPLAMNSGPGSQLQLAPWLYYPVFMPLSNHPIVRNLDGIRAEFSGTLDTIGIKGLKKTILLNSSPYSFVSEVPAMVSLQLISKDSDPERLKSFPKPVSVLIEGVFPAVFAHRPVPAGVPDTMHLPAKGTASAMMMLADGDVLKNQVNPKDGSPYPLGWDRYTNRQYGNKTFLRNAIDYLAGEGEIISLRGKEIKLRLLDQVKIKNGPLKWPLINVALPPLLFILCGLGSYLQRKRKYGIKR